MLRRVLNKVAQTILKPVLANPASLFIALFTFDNNLIATFDKTNITFDIDY